MIDALVDKSFCPIVYYSVSPTAIRLKDQGSRYHSTYGCLYSSIHNPKRLDSEFCASLICAPQEKIQKCKIRICRSSRLKQNAPPPPHARRGLSLPLMPLVSSCSLQRENCSCSFILHGRLRRWILLDDTPHFLLVCLAVLLV